MYKAVAENLKKYRLNKQLTQAETSEILGVSTKSISKWECGLTLPDASMLPKIAKAYAIMIDDLYENNPETHDKSAQRLAAVYDATTDLKDFVRATEEFKRLERKSQLTGEDLMAWGAMLCKMEKYAGEQALLFLKRALEKAKNTDEMLYFRIYEQIIDLQIANGNVDATVRELQRKIMGDKKSSEQYALLLYALNKSKKYIECYEMFLKAIEIFPGDWRILTMGGDICWNLEKREDAFKFWNKAIKLNSEWDAAKYAKAFAYEELGEKEKAYNMWMETVGALRRKHRDIEADKVEKRARTLYQKR